MARYRKTARIVRSLHLERPAHLLAGSLCEVATDRPVFHLTFDDGPHPEVTPRILEVLDEFEAPATFFLLTENAERHPGLVGEIMERGHEIGHHSRTHPRLSTAPWNRLPDEIWASRRDLERVAGRPVRLFRPPYGAHGLLSLYMVKSARMQTVLWSVDSEDWKGLSPDDPLQRTSSRIDKGGILLLHDRPATDSVQGDIAEGHIPKDDLTRRYLLELRRRGLRTVSLAELLGSGEEVRRAKVAK
ncbi:MAG: polysaccharide deacetylase family protein [Acidimicrobiia bacterium]